MMSPVNQWHWADHKWRSLVRHRIALTLLCLQRAVGGFVRSLAVVAVMTEATTSSCTGILKIPQPAASRTSWIWWITGPRELSGLWYWFLLSCQTVAEDWKIKLPPYSQFLSCCPLPECLVIVCPVGSPQIFCQLQDIIHVSQKACWLWLSCLLCWCQRGCISRVCLHPGVEV